MKIPLLYQRTEYDCGPTSLLNAFSFLFDLEDFPPDILRHLMICTLDSYNEKGEAYKNGTSNLAMSFIAGWLNEYAKATKFPVRAELFTGRDVYISEGSQILKALGAGGAAVVRVFLDCAHFVTLTGLSEEGVELFDPYYRNTPFSTKEIKMIDNKPFSANRLVAFEHFNREDKISYAFGPVNDRVAVILYNTNTCRKPEINV